MSVNHASPASAAEAAERGGAAAKRITRRARRVALATAAAAGLLGLAVVGVVYIGALLIQGVSLAITLVPRAIVWLALAAQDGADWWSLAGRAGAALATSLSSSQVMWWLIGLELLAVVALVALQAMLRSEIRGSDSQEEKK